MGVCLGAMSLALAYLQGEGGGLKGRIINLPPNSMQEVDEEAFCDIGCSFYPLLMTIYTSLCLCAPAAISPHVLW